MYAADRVKPPVPLKIEDKEVTKVAVVEETSVKAKASSVSEESKQQPVQSSSSASMEFNHLANLIGLAAEQRDTGGDDFKMNLFPDTVSDAGGLGSYTYKDSNVIEFDLGKNRAHTQDVKKKIL